MCYIITIAVPARSAGLVMQVFGRAFRASPTANPAIAAALPAGYLAMLITNGMCSCDLYAAPRSDSEPDPEDHLRKKFARRGWSEAKIARAVEQATQCGSRNLRVRGVRPDVVAPLQELCRAAGTVAVMVHWYGGPVDSEELSLTRAEPCACAELPARAAQLREDEILIATTRGRAVTATGA